MGKHSHFLPEIIWGLFKSSEFYRTGAFLSTTSLQPPPTPIKIPCLQIILQRQWRVTQKSSILDLLMKALSPLSADPPFQDLLSKVNDIFCVTYRDVMERDLKMWGSWGRQPEAALILHVTKVHKSQVEYCNWFGGSWLLVFLFWLFIVAVSASGDRIWRTEAP